MVKDLRQLPSKSLKELIIRCEKTERLREGQWIKLDANPDLLLKAALMGYGIPLIMAVLCSFWVNWVSPADVNVLLGLLLGYGLGMVLAKRLASIFLQFNWQLMAETPPRLQMVREKSVSQAKLTL